MSRSRIALVLFLAAPVVACSSDGGMSGGSGGNPASTGGTTGSGGSTGSGGTASTGGSTGSGGKVASTGGREGTGGVVGSGGVTPGTGGAVSGSGGATSGSGGAGGGKPPGSGGATAGTSGGGNPGHAGMSGGSGGSGGSTNTMAPKPSAGCSKGTGRPSGGMVSVANTSLHIFPTSYDGTTPFPLIIALHACGNANTEFVSQFKGTGFDTEYVQTYPNTPDSGQCWSNYSGDISRVLSQYDDIMATYCIDQNRVFATAHSSGAQFLVNIMSHKSDAQHLNLKAVSPVAADPFNVAIPIPVLYIDGKNDNQRDASSATNAVAKFRTANMCQSTSMPYSSIMTCKSVQNGATVDPGCIIYDGCTEPTIWCSHNDPNYSNTEHGIPCFAMKAMYDFFKSLP